MSWIALHFASGDELYSGAALMLLALALSTFSKARRARRVAIPALLIGALLVSLAAVPAPKWLLTAWWMALLGWLAARIWMDRSAMAAAAGDGAAKPRLGRIALGFAALAAVLTGTLVATEVVHAAGGSVRDPTPARSVTVVGDSLSVGFELDASNAWPRILARAQRRDVVDLARPGARLADAIAIVRDLPAQPDGVLVLEIGGNDLLGGTPVATFRRRLAELAALARQRAAHVYLCELPLPPLYGDFGRAQREIAAEHGLHLISRRRFAWVLYGGDATVDGLHLSPAGHERMSKLIWDSIRSHFPAESQ